MLDSGFAIPRLVRSIRRLLLVAMIFSLLESSLPVSHVAQLARTPSSEFAWVRLVEASIASQVSRLDSAAAIALAGSFTELSSANGPYSYAYSEVLNTWKLTANGEALWITINVVFSRYNGSAFDGWLVIKLDPGLTHIVSTEIQTGNPSANDYKNQIWSGYGFYTQNWGAVYEAYGSWKIPSISQPWTFACSTYLGNHPCAMSIWAGLTSNVNTNLVQGGSMAQLDEDLSASPYYQLWTEVLPNQTSVVDCGDTATTSGDSITSDVFSAGKSGGDVDQFNITVIDHTNWYACSVSYHNGKVGTPNEGLLMFERGNTQTGFLYTLPEFGDANGVNFEGQVYYGSSLHGIIDPYNAGYYETWSMWNPNNNGYHNIGFSTVFSNSSFNEYWDTSSGT